MQSNQRSRRDRKLLFPNKKPNITLQVIDTKNNPGQKNQALNTPKNNLRVETITIIIIIITIIIHCVCQYWNVINAEVRKGHAEPTVVRINGI